ncbi:MAG: group 1 glycosyl transferase [Candidatus Rokuibacteriota bacterium]|nr:MAG: group 1 glycosyl transferase [Candidatus Rokubacteria bacterium]
MRLIWVKVGGLWPVNTGGRIRSFHMLRELSRRHAVTLLTTHGPSEDPRLLAAALPECEVVSIPWALAKRGSARFALALVRSWLSSLPVDLYKARVPALRREVERRLACGGVDLVVADFLLAAPNLACTAAPPTVLFAHNVEHVIWQRLGEVERRAWRRILLSLESRKMRRYEARACAQARLTIAVSDADRELLAAAAPGASVRAVPTGVDIDYFAPDGVAEVPGRLVFTGSMDWYPNEDGIAHFIEAVLPRVRREVPAATLTVVGRNPSDRLRDAAAAAGVRVTGLVDDVRPHMAEAAVYVVPLRIGGGTRLKIFEALSMAKAVVSTAVGAEGLPVAPGRHFLQADEPAAFAEAVTSLLRDSARRRAIGAAGRRLVEERYSWSKVVDEFEKQCGEVLRHAS